MARWRGKVWEGAALGLVVLHGVILGAVAAQPDARAAAQIPAPVAQISPDASGEVCAPLVAAEPR